MQKAYTNKFLRKRKFLLMLPLITIPFVTMAFWALGGGKASAGVSNGNKQTGLNLQLPEPELPDESQKNKLSFYDKAQQDSIKLKQEMLNDPYYKNGLDTADLFGANFSKPIYDNKLNPSIYYPSGKSDPSEAKIYERLEAINQAIQAPDQPNPRSGNELNSRSSYDEGRFSSEIDRLENMLAVNSQRDESDPEMKQLETVMDKILDIQHPDRVKDRIKDKSVLNKETVYVLSKTPRFNKISLLDSGKKEIVQTGFYGIEEDQTTDNDANSIEAAIHENQVLVSGSVVKLRLLNDVYLNGTLIPLGTFVHGFASLNAERLQIEITSIRNQQALYPVKLEVYDLDGLPGIYIPGAITRDVAKQSVDNSLQMMELSTMDPSLKTQATAAGIGAAKTLLSKKVKQVKVLVKAGYKVLLKDKSLQ